MSTIKICPSILAADFGHLADEAKRVEQSGADRIHVDIMDGHFVQNLTIGPQVVAAINRATHLFLDVHLMMYNPFDYVERFIEAGADKLTIHFEATEDLEDTLAFIRRCGVKAGLALSPETHVEMLTRYLPLCDGVLLMTVRPGFGGQSFMEDVLEKVRFTRAACNRLGIREGGVEPADLTQSLPPFDIQVDGGINLKTAALSAAAGANDFVAGTYLFSQPNMATAVAELRQCCESHFCEKVAFFGKESG